MKFCMPVHAVALMFAVASDMFEHTSATQEACLDTGCTTASCPKLTDITTTEAVTKASPAAAFTATCTGTAKAYVKSLQIIADDANLPKVQVRASTTSAIVSTTSTPLKIAADPACLNSYLDIGKSDATDDVKLSIICNAVDSCTYRYKVEYACQDADACAAATASYECTTESCPAVPTATPTGTATSKLVTRPDSLSSCSSGKYAYLSKLTVFPDAGTTTLTKAADIVVRVSKNGGDVPTTDAAIVAKDVHPTCSNTYTDVGKIDATMDLKVMIGCASSVAKCSFRYKAEWACQPTLRPSGVTGACPVAAWGTALVGAVAGANFAEPL